MFGVLHWGTGSVAIDAVSIMVRLVPKRHGEGDRFLLWKIRLYSECSFEVLGACRLLPLFRRLVPFDAKYRIDHVLVPKCHGERVVASYRL